MFILNINITTVEYSMLRLNYTWITDHTNSKYGKDKILVVWSKYEINESEHKGEICYCIVKIEVDSIE